MNWFKKHLNWTAVLITIISNIASSYIVDLFLPDWEPIDPSGTPFLPSSPLFLLSDILIIIGSYWVLSKKNRSKAYLLFFVAFLVLYMPDFLHVIVFLPNLPWELSGLLGYLVVSLWIAGWTILLTLENKSPVPDDPAKTGKV